MDYEFLHSVFPNYTKEMYMGNEPKRLLPHINGDSIEEYDDYPNLGQVQIYHDELTIGSYTLVENVTCFICNGMMQIIYNGGLKKNCWAWTNADGGTIYGEKYISEAKLRRLLNVKKDDSKAWRIFKKKMMELFEEASFKGEYRDL